MVVVEYFCYFVFEKFPIQFPVGQFLLQMWSLCCNCRRKSEVD